MEEIFDAIAAPGADRRHGAAEGVPGKPERQRVVSQGPLERWPQVVHLALETAVDAADRFRQHGHRIGVGLHVIPFVRLSSPADHYAVVLVPETVGLGAVTIEEE